MRKSNAEAAKTRDMIVSTAASELRQRGIAEASLTDVMAAAGLTAGGFYRHFKNKDQLVGEALESAGFGVAISIRDAVSRGGFNDAVDAYLSTGGGDGNQVSNCPFSALGSEIARSTPETRAALTGTLNDVLTALANGAGGGKAGKRKAMFALSALVGALTLARISTDEALARDIIETARQRLYRAA